ncbi:PSP1 domain-containing protein [Pseudothermotoga thermarum]|uniref:PSP1 domain protein n=1 Tax=Pseudothermotoga thermarum DSM 5069 TaxID=688269 RepID=F7YX45_9THEM|nr:stage 0 sporulation family protein [Pseudothermotoga thermarum]AEH50855.1 PSP1 domain protein [Pseudothermotoga thermarum DSM 5069]
MQLMATVYGVEILPKGKIHYFAENGEDIKPNDLVLVMTEFGMDVGKVLFGPREMSIEQVGSELKPIIRKLTQEDLAVHEQNLKDAQEALKICKEKVKEHQLPMKLLHARYMFDRSRLVFFFSSETRVDFRELVKDLARIFKTRIELRQVGVRDEMRFFGGLGLCGLPTCCSTFLREFDSITLKHAKCQQLMINTAKISGACRRLLCCLLYEYDFYAKELEGIPSEGETVVYEDKKYKVQTVDVFRQRLSLVSEDGQMIYVPFSYFRGEKNAPSG